MKNIFKRPATVVTLTVLLVLTMVLSASAAATTKAMSTNFALVNLATGANSGTINYIKSDGSQWRAPETFNLTTQGSQLNKYQYSPDAGLSAGTGSVVVSTNGPMGAVVQIRSDVPGSTQVSTRGAYSGSTSGAQEAYVPLVAKNGTSASGLARSQVIVQNTGVGNATIEIRLVNLDASTRYTKTGINLVSGASYTYDLTEEPNVPDGWFGSAVVRATNSGGQVAVVSNFFTGNHGMQTYNAFTTRGQNWLVPLFTSRLPNSLSAVVRVQNLSGGAIDANGITMSCIKDPLSPGSNFELRNPAAVGNSAAYEFNPVTDNRLPSGWFGSCRVTTPGKDTVVFVQLRYVGQDMAAAYEAIPSTGTNTKVIIPVYLKRLTNGFATVITVQNLSSTQAANVELRYQAATDADPPLPANCSATFNVNIPAGASIQQNHTLTQDGPGFVPQIGLNCRGTLVATSTNGVPIDSFVQIRDVNGLPGDTYQAHNGFTVAN